MPSVMGNSEITAAVLASSPTPLVLPSLFYLFFKFLLSYYCCSGGTL
jgi:hypothetical protein